MLRSYITITNTETKSGGRNSGNLDQAFIEVNGIIYDDYNFADPLSLGPVPTASKPEPKDQAGTFIEQNFYRIFYPQPDDEDAVKNNPWLAIDVSNCPVE